MSCSCGSGSIRNGSATARSSAGLLELRFGSCSGCGRVGSEILICDGERKCTGIQARKEFQCLKDGSHSSIFTESSGPGEVKTAARSEKSVSSNFDLAAAAQASEYHPYKLMFIGTLEPIYTVFIKSPSPPHYAACPAMGVFIKDDDYLEATFRMVRVVKNVLGVDQATRVSTTCTRPFPLDAPEVGSFKEAQANVQGTNAEAQPVGDDVSEPTEDSADHDGQLELAL